MPDHLALLLVAGLLAGLIGSGAGLASLVSYPALLLTGLPPLAANVSNTVALTISSLTSVPASWPELRGQVRRLVPYVLVALVGGVVGMVLLLAFPAEAFEAVVPWLIALASVALLARPWLQKLRSDDLGEHHPLVVSAVGLVCVYGGYFGAAAGVLVMAVIGAVVPDRWAYVNASKNVLLAVSNLTASIGFLLLGPVVWSATLPLAAGALVGAALGPAVVRRLPETPVRLVIGVAGLALAVRLALG
ncbi:sulfite exporter TauE/SafE family protein [Angustibacter speluncae]